MSDRRMQIADLADGLVRRNNMPFREAEAFVRQFFDVISDGLFHENIVKVKGLGTFKLVGVEPRESVNVNTGERIQIAGHTKVSFTPDPVLRDAVNKPFSEFETVMLNEHTPLAAMESMEPTKVPVEQTVPATVELSAEDEETDTEEGFTAEEEQPMLEGQPSMAAEPTTDEQPASDDDLTADEEPLAEEEPSVDEEPLAEDEPLAEEELTTEEQPIEETTVAPPASASVVEKATVVKEARVVQHADNVEMAEHVPHHHGPWHVVLALLFTVLVFLAGYCVGYLRPVSLPSFSQSKTETPQPSATSKPTAPKKKAQKPAPKQQTAQQPQPAAAQQPANAASADSVNTATKPAAAKKPSEVLAYPQVEGGEYYIVGIKGTEVMSAGKTLLNISIKYYHSKDFVQYICTLNGITNPDIVPLDKELKIPELKHK